MRCSANMSSNSLTRGKPKVKKMCQNCHKSPAKDDYKYCGTCMLFIKKTLKSSGYLTKDYFYGKFRPFSAMENTYETKFGVDY